MPTVPGLLPSVAPSDAAIPSVRVSADAAAFGGTVGTALAHLGESVGHASNEIWQRAVALQQLRNESDAKEADAKYMMETGKLHAEFNTLQGKDAVDAFPKYQEDLQQLRLSIRKGLPNEQAQKMYDSSALSFMGRNIFNGAGHAASEGKKAAAGTSQALVDQEKDNVLHNPGDNDAYERGVIRIQQEAHTVMAPIRGWGPEQTKQYISDQVSSMTALRIQGLARTQPFAAKSMLDENRARLRYDDLDKVDRIVQSQMRTVGARNLSDEVNSPPPDGWAKGEEPSLQSRIDKAMAKADQIAPDDPVFSDFVRDRVIADFNRGKAVKRDFELSNRNTVEGALMGGVGGKMPTTVEELRGLDPKVDKAWESLDEIHQRSYMKALAQNAKGDTAWNDTSLRRYQALKGKAAESPAEFLDTDVVSEKMPVRARLELVNLQQKLKNQAEGDPRTTRALQQLRPMLGSAGLTKAKDEEGYYRYVGALQDQLQIFQETNRRPPKPEELQDMGARLLQQHVVPNSWMDDPWIAEVFGSKTRFTDLPVPEKADAIIKADPKWEAKGIVPDEAMRRRVYINNRYQELYGGSAKKSEVPGTRE